MLEVETLTAGYGRGVVLDGVSLTVGAGEVVGLLGLNGAGKTTLLRTLMGLVQTRAGRVRFDGDDITGCAPFEVAGRGVAYVPQGREIFGDFTVEDNLRLGNLGETPFDLAFHHFPALESRRRQRAGELSGGQQQQLAIARALMNRPRLLLLDEPSEGLQPSIVGEITETLTAIAETTGAAILLVEQNIDMVLALADACAFLETGRIEARHSADALRAQPEILHDFLAL
ncbi:MAG TPA: ABC transporter ATP-binding protein [Alphaproteobacteria bacterium]|nr:ABC transporter ATP-binding protein [Alphaproteobacteria bacterium]